MAKKDSLCGKCTLQARAGGLFVLVEGVGVDIQRGGGLAVAEDALRMDRGVDEARDAGERHGAGEDV